MVGLLIAIVAYIVASTGFFGGDIIYTLDVVENWYYFIAVVIGLIAAAVMLGLTAGGAAAGSSYGKLGGFGGALAGYSMGGLIAALMLLKIGIQIWLVTWLMGSIDPQAVDFDALTNKQMLALGALVILALIPSRSGGSSK